MKFFIAIFILLFSIPSCLFSQENDEEVLDTLYREDQFYFGATYNLLRKMPAEMSQNGFSSGFHFGFIRDMPINAKRNFAIGLGLGYSGNSINQNLRASKDSQGDINYEIVASGSFSKNKISMHLIELPIEFRWRTSTPDSYKFWRIYTGIKFGYLIASSTKYKGDLEEVKLNGINDLNKFQYGLTLSTGYDKFNVHMYYALNAIFKDNTKTNTANFLDLSVIRIGLMLYIL